MPPKKTSSKPVTRRSHRALQDSTGRGEPRFNRLPTELISEIFLAYHHITQAPILLLLVCRHWRDIALSISSLWGTIRFQTWNSHQVTPPIEMTMHWPITCLFESVPGRAGEAILSIGNLLEKVGDYADTNSEVRVLLSTRCRKLHVNLSYGGMVGFVGTLRDLANLEQLSLNAPIYAMDHIVSRILENIEAASPQLVNLETTGFLPTGLHRRLELMERLRRLCISVEIQLQDQNEYDALLEHLHNLEELIWPFNTPTTLHHISGTLRTLAINHCSSFPSLRLGRLTSLTLRCTKAPVEDLDVVDLPCLRHFIFSGSWERFALIRAGRLSTLDFEGWDLQDKRALVPSATVHARYLTITNGMTDGNTIELLSGIWSEVEEIHWVYKSRHITFGRELTAALSGTKYVEPLCPQLRHLTVKTVGRAHYNDKSITGRLESRLRAIARMRHGYGRSLQSTRWRWDKPRADPRFFTGLSEFGENSEAIL